MNKRILWIAMSLVMIFTNVVNVSASPISDAKNKKKDAEKKLNAINEDIEDIEDQKEDLEQEAEEYEQQLVDLLVTIQIINHDIENKEDEIETAKAEYEVALAKQEKQQWAMNKRIKYMYEKGDMNYMQILLESKKFSDAVNKSTYSEKLYAYDRYQLYLYEQTKEEVIEKQKALDEDMAELEEIKLDAVSQEEELQLLVDEYSENIENFDEQLSGAKEKASQYKEQIQKQSEQIKALEAEEQRKALEAAKKKAEEEAKRKAEEEARRKAEEEASAKANEEGSNSEESSDNGDNNDEGNSSGSESSDGGSSGGSSSGGSAKGQEIANFACQFVGNPYVPGGTSLTEGADCSGFTMAVYNNFGLSLPRSSYAQAGYGREVSYSEAQPGDIIYYGGHVGIYIGNGLIVHASTQATGIKISNALYRSIITVRRIV
ncbi:MAG: NlpC/P60 family protein [Lachnospiraceae bacterium]|nr:NlpC/P60 family protein [Lachnospiraceae bacterium]MDY5640379.1 NlpC/P60 family protein [Lachnospiraceae bacterium]